MDSSPLIRSHTTDGSYVAGEFCFLELPSRPKGEMPLEEKAAFRMLLEWGRLCPDDLLSDVRRELEDFLTVLCPLGDQYKNWAEDIRVAFGIEVSLLIYYIMKSLGKTL